MDAYALRMGSCGWISDLDFLRYRLLRRDEEEEDRLIEAHKKHGNKWADIARCASVCKYFSSIAFDRSVARTCIHYIKGLALIMY